MNDKHQAMFRLVSSAAQGVGRVQRTAGRSATRHVRASSRPSDSKLVRLQLVDVDGMLQWQEVSHAAARPSLLRRGAGGITTRDDGGIAELEFEKLPPSQITQFLSERDDKFNPERGIRRWNHKTKRLIASPPPAKGNVLLLVHGTFSSGQHFIDELLSTPDGEAFLEAAAKEYNNQVFVFDHATLSVGPLLNAIDLDWAFAGSTAEIDLISHSRGGLIARWWCEHLHPGRCRRIVLVGCPLAGTGLAAPPRLRATIDMLTQFGNALETVLDWSVPAVPLMGVVTALLKVVTSVTSLTARTPIVDAVIAAVPGIFAMSRVGNNPELLRMRMGKETVSNDYFAIGSSYEPEEPGLAFWRWFRKDLLTSKAADFVFDAQNDLVVDTSSMIDLADKKFVKKVFTFEQSPEVHHLNYFRQSDTLKHLRKWLDI
jgi:pimeloyl-ACP methyl ester carboxylesterase